MLKNKKTYLFIFLLLIMILAIGIYKYDADSPGKLNKFEANVVSINDGLGPCSTISLNNSRLLTTKCDDGGKTDYTEYKGTVERRLKEGDNVEVQATRGIDEGGVKFYYLTEKESYIRKI